MEIEEYCREVKKTWNTEPDHKYQVANAAMGIVGELGEVNKDFTPEEIGDVYYYTAMLAVLLDKTDLLDDSHEPLNKMTDTIKEDILKWGLEILELVKKYTFHSTDETSRKGYAEGISVPIFRLHDNLVSLIKKGAVDPSDVRKRNIEKLSDRHPDGWDGGKET